MTLQISLRFYGQYVNPKINIKLLGNAPLALYVVLVLKSKSSCEPCESNSFEPQLWFAEKYLKFTWFLTISFNNNDALPVSNWTIHPTWWREHDGQL